MKILANFVNWIQSLGKPSLIPVALPVRVWVDPKIADWLKAEGKTTCSAQDLYAFMDKGDAQKLQQALLYAYCECAGNNIGTALDEKSLLRINGTFLLPEPNELLAAYSASISSIKGDLDAGLKAKAEKLRKHYENLDINALHPFPNTEAEMANFEKLNLSDSKVQSDRVQEAHTRAWNRDSNEQRDSNN